MTESNRLWESYGNWLGAWEAVHGPLLKEEREVAHSLIEFLINSMAVKVKSG